MRVVSPSRTLVAALVALGAACSSPPSSPAAEAGHGSAGESGSGGGESGLVGVSGDLTGEVSCSADSRVDTYVAGLTKQGKQGILFRLETSDPAPPAKNANTFEVAVLDSNGAALAGDLRIDLTMPDHGHGTQVTPIVTYDETTGLFEIAPVWLFMAGVWRVELALYPDADADTPLDSAVFFFCIEG